MNKDKTSTAVQPPAGSAPLPEQVTKALTAFDKAARDWGWQIDQGLTEQWREHSKAEYERTKAELVTAIQEALGLHH